MEDTGVGALGFSDRAAVGLVTPFDMELDRELWRWLPADVDLLIARTPFVNDGVTVAFVKELSSGDGIANCVRSVTSGRAEAVAYACTSASFVNGRAGERAIRDSMLAAGAAQAVTTSGALVEAIKHLGVGKVAVATPYLPELSQLLDTYLDECGIKAVNNEALGLETEIWGVPYDETADLIRRVDRPEAEALVVSCTNLPTYDLIAPLEQELGKPIISANQATMRALLKRIGRSAVGPGQALMLRG